jgi:hypothetical protein
MEIMNMRRGNRRTKNRKMGRCMRREGNAEQKVE